MDHSTSVIATLVIYKVVLIGIGVWARRRTHDVGDFFLGGRKLGGFVAALSASASNASAWTLLALSGFAFTFGMPVMWLVFGIWIGYLLSWLWVAPRLRVLAEQSGALTLVELILGDTQDPYARHARRAASFVIIFCFSFYVAAQFRGAGLAFADALGMSQEISILLGATIILAYTLLGGFWAVSVTDALQGMLMFGVALFLPPLILFAAADAAGISAWTLIVEQFTGPALALTQPHIGWAAAGFVFGSLGIGLPQAGQPHVVNRFMALRDEQSLRRGRLAGLTWMAVVTTGMACLGMILRGVYTEPGSVDDPEQVLFYASREFLTPLLAGLITAGVLSAIMSTADSQLLVCASSIARDWNLVKAREREGLGATYLVVVLVTGGAMVLALFAPDSVFRRVLFAWHALGAAFAPLVFMAVLGRRVDPRYALACLLLGFGLTAGIHLFSEDTPGDFVERLLPWFLSLGIAYLGTRTARAQRGPGGGAGGAGGATTNLSAPPGGA